MLRRLSLFLLLLAALAGPARAQYCVPGARFTQTPVFSLAQVASVQNVVYGQARNYQGQMQALTFNIFYPDFAADPLPKRPFVLIIHGGSFLTGDGSELNATCQEFARRGYVAATLKYRLGWNASGPCAQRDTVSQSLAAYRGVQDAHAAMRYLAANAATFRIDTTWMFAGGNSAGAFISADLAFVQQAEMNSRVPNAVAQLGPLNTSGNALTTRFRLRGLFQNWGAVISDRFITAADAIPMVAFHGDRDQVAPIDAGHNDCPSGVVTYGSRSIYNRLVQLGQCAELNVKVGGCHGVYNDTPAQDVFRIEHAACFFKSLFCNSCTPVTHLDSIPSSCARLASATAAPDARPGALAAYPNPTTSQLQLSGLPAGPAVRLVVYNSLGACVLTAADARLPLDVSGLPAGLFILRATSAAGDVRTLRFVKQE